MYSESLVRFRYAEMIMDGGAVPKVDKPLQWPEGFPTATMILPLPDHFTGSTYRAVAAVAARPIDHYAFLRWFMAVYGGLYVPAMALLFWVMFRKWVPTLAAASLYVILLPTFLRAAGNYLREDFATPPLMVATAFLWLLLESNTPARRKWFYGAALTAAVAAAMSCWHMAQFYVNVLLGVTLLSVWCGRKAAYGVAGLGLLVGTLVAGAVNLPLLSKGVLWSPTATVAAAVAAWGFAGGDADLRWSRRLLLGALAAAAAGLAVALAGQGAYGHAYALIIEKIRFFGLHPQDPTKLSPDARIFWMGPYDTITAHRAVVEYGLLLATSTAAVVWGLLIKPAGAGRPLGFFAAAMTIITAFLFIILARLSIFFAPWAVAVTVLPLAHARRPAARISVAAALAAVFAAQTWWTFNYTRPTAVRRAVDVLPQARDPLWTYGRQGDDVFGWLRDRTPADSPVLAQFGISASILYWSHRPVVLHPMFEVAEIRPKILKVAAAYAGPEDAFYHLCRAWGAKYVLFNAPVWLVYEPPGDRFFACAPHPPDDAVGNLMQFYPERLRRFRLVHETYSFRIYEVGRPYDGYRARRYHPYFDREVFSSLPTPEQYYALAGQLRRAGDHYTIAGGYLKRGAFKAAAAEYAYTLKLHPDYEDAELMLGYCLAQLGRWEEAGRHFDRALAIAPDDPLAHTYAGSYYLTRGDYRRAREEYAAAYRLAPDDPDNLTRLRLVEASPNK